MLKRGFIGLTCCSALAASRVLAVPVVIDWHLNASPKKPVILDVTSEDATSLKPFAPIVKGHALSWDVAKPGVYAWVAKSTDRMLAKGCFAIVAGKSATIDHAHLTWEQFSGADRYLVELSTGKTRVLTMMTSETAADIPLQDSSVAVSVIAMQEKKRLSSWRNGVENLHLDALALTPNAVAGSVSENAAAQDSKPKSNPSPLSAASTATAPKVTAHEAAPGTPSDTKASPDTAALSKAPAPGSSSSQEAAEPAPMNQANEAAKATAAKPAPVSPVAPNPVATPTAGAANPPSDESNGYPANRLKHLVYAFASYGSERFQAQKQEIDLLSLAKQPGGGGGFWTYPGAGIVVSGEADFHRHQNRLASVMPSGAPTYLSLDVPRLDAGFAVGYDVLHLASDRLRQVLELFATTRYSEFSMLPTVYDDSNGQPPVFTSVRVIYYGGGLGYVYRGERLGLSLEGGYASAKKPDGEQSFGRFTCQYNVVAGLALLAGGYYRQSSLTRCDANPAICLREGKVQTVTGETAGFIGIGAALK